MFRVAPVTGLIGTITVSYTHLDVYKRQLTVDKISVAGCWHEYYTIRK